MKTRRLTMAAAIVEFLKQQHVARDGAEHRLVHGVFGIFGHGNVAGLGQALDEHGGTVLPYRQPKNEQAMVHAAIAFAKARRGLGTYACTSSIGPGATNMVTGAATATINRLPVLLLPGDIFASRLPGPVLQQLEHPLGMDQSVNDCFRPVSRYWDRLLRPEQALAALPEAMRVLSDPAAMGAVTLALPQDVQAEAWDYPEVFFEKRVHHVRRARPDEDALRTAAEWIRHAERPLLVAGGGVYYSEAEAALRAFADATGIPVAVTQAGKGVLADDHAAALGGVGVTGTQAADRTAAEADLVIAVGTRLSDFTTASRTQFQHPAVRFVSVNVSTFDAHKHGALPLVADARAALEALRRALEGHHVGDAYAREIAARRAEWAEARAAILHPRVEAGRPLAQAEAIRVVNETLGADGIVVHAAGGLPGDLHELWWSRGGDYHSEYGYSCMGYEIAGAMGVKLARPDRDVVAMVGDGSYLMLCHELVTCVQEALKITVVLLDNHGYQCIHGLQRSCGSDGFGNEFRRREGALGRLTGEPVAVDYVANARSLGVTAFAARDAAGLAEALAAARREPGPCLVHVPVDPAAAVPGYSWWDVPVSEVSERPAVRDARRRWEEGAARRRFHH